jgi:hypothetical protein
LGLRESDSIEKWGALAGLDLRLVLGFGQLRCSCRVLAEGVPLACVVDLILNYRGDGDSGGGYGYGEFPLETSSMGDITDMDHIN